MAVSVHHIDNLADPRLAPYRDLPDRVLARGGEHFIAEGRLLVERLLASDLATQSIMVGTKHEAQWTARVPDHVPLYVLPEELIRQVVGYKFHAGAIACGVRPPRLSIDEVLRDQTGRVTLVICPKLYGSVNVGSIVRTSAAFGATALILGEKCHDPFYRLAVRVSMGAAFSLPIVQSADITAELTRLKEQWSVDLVAATTDEGAKPLNGASRGDRLAILLGNEAEGLADQHIAMCDRQATIPMHQGTDSLNVAVAAAVFLYQFAR